MRKVAFFVFALLLSNICANKDIDLLPLWGSEWVILDGANKRIHYRSVGYTQPRKAFKVNFIRLGGKENYAIHIRYANLDLADYRNTADVIDSIKAQWSRNENYLILEKSEIDDEEYVSIKKVNYGDSTWSCVDNMRKIDEASKGKYRRFFRSVNGVVDTLTSAQLSTDTLFSVEKPICFAERLMGDRNDDIYNICEEEIISQHRSEMVCYKDNVRSVTGFRPHCLKNKSLCYDDLSYNYTLKIVDLPYWQVHLYPRIFYNCRSPETGRALRNAPECVMTVEQAKANKEKSLNNSSDINLRKFRNPIFDDTLSIHTSFAFVEDPNTKMNQLPYIWMDNPSGTIPLSRNPKYMIRINQNSYPIVNDEIAIFAQYLDAKEDVNHFLDFDMHCPGWYAIDRLNAWQYNLSHIFA
jgi:hypothetical protein